MPIFGDPDELERLLGADEHELSILVAEPLEDEHPLIWANEQFYARTGYTEAEVLGRDWTFLAGEYTDDDAVELIYEIMREGKAVDLDVRLYRKDRSTFWNRVRVRSIYDGDWNLSYFVATHRLITPSEIRPVPVVSDERDKLQLRDRTMKWN
ncbi:MAG: PAS domain-containing protein [Acetobacterales bacterium]